MPERGNDGENIRQARAFGLDMASSSRRPRLLRPAGRHHQRRRQCRHPGRMVLGLLWLFYPYALFSFLTSATPVEFHRNDTAKFVARSERSLFWGWAWGTESTVSIVDRTPPISFPSRPGELSAVSCAVRKAG